MKLEDKARYDKIEQEVADILEECAAELSLPLDLFMVCNINSYILYPYSTLVPERLSYAKSISDDGFTRIMNVNGMDRYCIFYNDSLCQGRIRFTIAHEIGHIRLGHLEWNKLPYEEAEAEANYFAKYLLSPHPVSNKLHLQNPQDFMETYNVSEQTATYTYYSYEKWVTFGSSKLHDHERTILRAFGMLGL